MTVFASKEGAFKEATGMWASKDGLWTPVPLGEPPPPDTGPWVTPPWKLSAWAGSPINSDRVDVTAVWEGTDIVVSLPPPTLYLIYGYIVTALIFPLNFTQHPHTAEIPRLTSNALMSRWSLEYVPFSGSMVGHNAYFLMSWAESSGVTGTGGWWAIEAIGNSWGPPLVIPEPGFPIPHGPLNFPTGTAFATGFISIVLWVTQTSLNAGGPSTMRIHADGCEWGFVALDGSNIPASELVLDPLAISDEFREGCRDFFEADLSNMTPEQRTLAEKQRLDPRYQRFAPPPKLGR